MSDIPTEDEDRVNVDMDPKDALRVLLNVDLREDETEAEQ